MEALNLALENCKDSLIGKVRSHSFLRRCRTGRVTRPELMGLLVQQGLYSSYFTRYLCGMMSNLPKNSDVLALAENLFEELGLDGDQHSTPHYIIYRNMLESFSLTLDNAVPSAETSHLINTMLAYCRHPDPAYGLGALCLGAEALVPSVYSDIIQGFNACGIGGPRIEFFRIHVECDDGHAETIRDIMIDLAEARPAAMQSMIDAGTALVDARMGFFAGIERAYAESFQAAHAA